ncbi:MAG: hypothetical protein PHV34_22785 [Verrucomicrobiae bacterium]|nr:hypothetical protein [Verrucomicrobiae bacterium]
MKNKIRLNGILVAVFTLIAVAVGQAETKPSITPNTKQVAGYSNTGETLDFSASGGSPDEPTTTAKCPPWKKDGDPWYEWELSGLSGWYGSTDSAYQVSRGSPGTGTIKAKNVQSWVDDKGNSGGTTFVWSDPVDVYVVKLELKEVSFSGTGNQRMRKGMDFLSENGAMIESPEWKVGQAGESVCYTKGSVPSVSFKLGITPDLGSASLSVKIRIKSRQVGSSTGEVTKDTDITVSGSEKMVSGISTTLTLDNKIDNTNLKIKWQWKSDGSDTYIDLVETTDLLYVTYGVPGGSEKTDIRLSFVSRTAKGQTQVHPATESLYGTIQYDPGVRLPSNQLWSMATGQPAQCVDGANYLRLASNMCGLTLGDVKFIFPAPGKSEKLEGSRTASVFRSASYGNNGHSSMVNNPTGPHGNADLEFLIFIDGAGKANNYEATYVLTSDGATKYYCPGAAVYSDIHSAMVAMIVRTLWVWDVDDNGVYQCIAPGPWPEATW